MTPRELKLIHVWTLPANDRRWCGLSFEDQMRADQLAGILCEDLGVEYSWKNDGTVKVLTGFLKVCKFDLKNQK